MDNTVVTDDPREIMRIIYEQATRNYAQYLARCQRRAAEAAAQVQEAADELTVMTRKLERSYGRTATS